MLRDGLQLAIHAMFNNIAIEGHNKIMIQSLKGNIQVPWQTYNIIEDIHIWHSQGIHLFINHIFRKASMIAD